MTMMISLEKEYALESAQLKSLVKWHKTCALSNNQAQIATDRSPLFSVHQQQSPLLSTVDLTSPIYVLFD